MSFYRFLTLVFYCAVIVCLVFLPVVAKHLLVLDIVHQVHGWWHSFARWTEQFSLGFQRCAVWFGWERRRGECVGVNRSDHASCNEVFCWRTWYCKIASLICARPVFTEAAPLDGAEAGLALVWLFPKSWNDMPLGNWWCCWWWYW